MLTALLATTTIFVQTPPVEWIRGDEDMVAALWETTLSSATEFQPTGIPFRRGLRVSFASAADDPPWRVQLGRLVQHPVQRGDTVYVQVWMRSPQRCRTTIVFEQASQPHSKYISAIVRPGPEWKEFRVAGRAGRSYEPGQTQIKFFFGGSTGTVEVAGVRVTNFGPRPPAGAIRETIELYPDGAPPASWYQQAERRIRQIRMGDLRIRVLDERGRPVPNASVRVEQLRHHFRFGTAGPATRVVEKSPDGDKYREVLLRLFNTFTFENDLKWQAVDWGINQQVIDEAIEWLHQNGFSIRGHCLVWGGWNNLPRFLRDLDRDGKIKALQRRIAEQAGRYKGKVYVWDVVNEAVTNTDLWEEIGWAWFDRSFQLTRETDPDVLLAYNDFSITTEAATGPAHRRRAIALAKRVRQAGYPIDIFGDQAHMGLPATPPQRCFEIWDEVARETGCNIEITEFDFASHNEDIQARYVRDYLTAAFSHPKVVAFVMWGFWENSHWLASQGAAMIRSDWTWKPGMRVFEDLVKRRWWTNTRTRTNPQGSASVRAFYGRHRVIVQSGPTSASATVDLVPGSKGELTVRLDRR